MRRLFRWLLQLAPADFRREYGSAVLDMTARRLAESAGLRFPRRLMRALRELLGLMVLVRAERARARRTARAAVHAHPVAPAVHGWAPRPAAVLARELRHASRRLRRSPGFAVTACLTLAIAIGANLAIFTLVHRIVWNPLPYPDADALVYLDHTAPGLGADRGVQVSSGLYFQYGERASALDGIALHWTYEGTLTGSGEPERIRVSRGTPSLPGVLRTGMGRGRWFSASEGVPGARPVAVLSHDLWARRYGSDPDITNGAIVLDGVVHDVIGVLPASFAYPDARTDLWLAAQFDPAAEGGWLQLLRHCPSPRRPHDRGAALRAERHHRRSPARVPWRRVRAVRREGCAARVHSRAAP